MCKLSIALPLLFSSLKKTSSELDAEAPCKNASCNNRTLVISAATRNTSWTKAVTENHALWAKLVARSDYRYVEDPHFGVRELKAQTEELDQICGLQISSHSYHVSVDSKAAPRNCQQARGAKRLQPHWLKIHVLRHLMMQDTSTTFSSYSHILWVDDDIVFTSRVNLVQALYEKMDANTHLVIAQDVGHTATGDTADDLQEDTNIQNEESRDSSKVWRQVNTGFMFWRNSPESRALLELVWEQRLSHLGFCPNQSCLHEQEALNNILWDSGTKLWIEDPTPDVESRRVHPSLSSQSRSPKDAQRQQEPAPLVSKIVHVLEPFNPAEPALNVNTVWRLTHTWKGEIEAKNYNGDPLHRRWHWGDNMAHVSGMTSSCRREMLVWLAQYVKKWVFNFNGIRQNNSEYEGSAAIALRDLTSSPPALWWHPSATAQCVREAAPSGGGNWLLPRRGPLDWDAALVAYTQGTWDAASLSDHQNREDFADRTAVTFLWHLLPKQDSATPRGLPYLFTGLLQQLTDKRVSGIERYWYLVLYAVKVNGKYFADVDPETLNSLSGFTAQGKWCSTPVLSDGSGLVALPSSHSSVEDSSAVALPHQRLLPVDATQSKTSQMHGLMPCSPYSLLALSAVAQNPEVFTSVSLGDLSFVEYHSIALEAVMRQPEQLANVEAMHYLDLVGFEKGGRAYYDLAMEAVCLEGSALQHVHKVSAMGISHDERDLCNEQTDPEAGAPLLLLPEGASLARAGSSFSVSLAKGRSHSRDYNCDRSSPQHSLMWPWEVEDATGTATSRSVGQSKRARQKSKYFKLALAAVSNDGFALQFVSIEDLNLLEDDYFALAEAAVAQNGKAFAFIQPSALGGAMSDTYYELALKAVYARGEAFWEVDTAFLSDTELIVLVLKAIRNGDPAAFKAFNAREAIKRVKGLYTELALLALSGVGVETFVKVGTVESTSSGGVQVASGSSFSGGSSSASSPTVGVLEFLDAGRISGTKARYAMAEAALRQDSSADVWEQVQELFQEGMRREDYEHLREKYGDPTI